MSHTYVTMTLSAAAFDEIRSLMEEAGYDHVFMDGGGIDMHGVAVVREAGLAVPKEAPLTINEAAHGLEEQMLARENMG